MKSYTYYWYHHMMSQEKQKIIFEAIQNKDYDKFIALLYFSFYPHSHSVYVIFIKLFLSKIEIYSINSILSSSQTLMESGK